EQRAHPLAGGKIPAIDDGETEATRRHRMGLVRDRVVEGDLDRGDLGDLEEPADDRAVDSPIDAVSAEQHHAVSGAAFLAEPPDALRVEPDDGGKPALAVEVEPLLGHAQMALD